MYYHVPVDPLCMCNLQKLLNHLLAPLVFAQQAREMGKNPVKEIFVARAYTLPTRYLALKFIVTKKHPQLTMISLSTTAAAAP